MIERVSLEPSRRCDKGCGFCYNGSTPEGTGDWSLRDVVDFGRDLAKNGVRVLSIGGGEPTLWPELFDALDALRGSLLRSLTTHGLSLDDPAMFERLVAARPDKVHISIHNPKSASEVRRVIGQAHALSSRGVMSGVNLLVAQCALSEARTAARALHAAGIGNERIVYLPMRGRDTPTAAEVASVAGGPFQSMTCLPGCAKSPRFVSVAADRTVAWCSYTRTRNRLSRPTFAALVTALDGLGLQSCEDGQLVRLGRATVRGRAAPSTP